MEVRLAGPEEAEEVADVFIPSFEGLTFLPMLHSHDEHRAFVRALLERDEVWVVEEDDRVVGMAVLSEDTLSHLYVHPDAQDRGVGGALLRQAKARRPGGFTLWVFQENAGARRFYERHGLRAVRFTDGSGNEEKTPDALYEWRPCSAQRQEDA